MKQRDDQANDLGNDAATVGANPDDNDPVDNSGLALGGGLVAASDDLDWEREPTDQRENMSPERRQAAYRNAVALMEWQYAHPGEPCDPEDHIAAGRITRSDAGDVAFAVNFKGRRGARNVEDFAAVLGEQKYAKLREQMMAGNNAATLRDMIIKHYGTPGSVTE